MSVYRQADEAARRLNLGWFGQPWPSGVCYTPEGDVDVSMQIPVPVGQACLECHEPFLEIDQGKAIPTGRGVAYVHKECLILQVVGPLAHLERRCPCYGGESHTTAGLSRRQEAVAVWGAVTRSRA